MLPSGKNNHPGALAAQLLPIAREILEHARNDDLPSGNLQKQIRSLMQGVDADHAVTTVLGALASAVLDLDHSISAGQLKADDPPEVLTGQLFRLAYNRWQNEQRREARMLQDIQRNAPPSDHGQGLRRDSPAESAPKKSNSPVFDAQIRELHDYMVETLDPRDMTIWIMYSEGFSEAEIAEKIQRHRTSVNRKIRRFGEIVERFLNAPSDRQD